MKIYLFRHAEKANIFHPNPSLSSQGEAQSLRLLERVQSSEMPRPTQLWVSPKKRTQLSFQPLAQQLNLQFRIEENLDEKQNGEDHDQFGKRIQQVFQDLAGQDGVIYLCTHMDWLEECLSFIPSEQDLLSEVETHWSPLQYVAFNLKNGSYELIEQKRIPL